MPMTMIPAAERPQGVLHVEAGRLVAGTRQQLVVEARLCLVDATNQQRSRQRNSAEAVGTLDDDAVATAGWR